MTERIDPLQVHWDDSAVDPSKVQWDESPEESYAGRVGHNLATFGRSALAGGLNLAATAQQINPTNILARHLTGFDEAAPTRALAEYAAPKIDPNDFGDKVESFLGGMEPQLAASAIAPQALGVKVLPWIEKALTGAAGMSLPAAESARATYEQGAQDGLTPLQAGGRAGVAGLGTLAMGGLPQVFGKSALTRALSGGAIGTGIGEAQRLAENAATPADHANLIQQFDPANAGLMGVFGAGMGAAHGPSPAEVAALRTSKLADTIGQRAGVETAPADPITKAATATQDALTGIAPDVAPAPAQPPPPQQALAPALVPETPGQGGVAATIQSLRDAFASAKPEHQAAFIDKLRQLIDTAIPGEQGGREANNHDVAAGGNRVEPATAPDNATRENRVAVSPQEVVSEAVKRILSPDELAKTTAANARAIPDSAVAGSRPVVADAIPAEGRGAGQGDSERGVGANTEIPEHELPEWVRTSPHDNPEYFGLKAPTHGNLLDAIAQGGGLDREAFRAEFGVDPAEWNTRTAQRGNMRFFGKPLFRKGGGMRPDDLREMLQQDGWLSNDDPNSPPKHSVSDAFDLVDKAMRDGNVIHPLDEDFAAHTKYIEANQRDHIEQEKEARKQGFKSLQDKNDAQDVQQRLDDSFNNPPPAHEGDVVPFSRVKTDNSTSDMFGAKQRQERTGAPRPQTADLFGGANAKDHIDAAVRERMEQLRGNGTAVPMRQGKGDLFAGPRPEQATIPPKKTDTPAFRQFFGDSKVVDANGNPLEVHHGTADDFNEFKDQHSGDNTGHMTAPLGHFFAEDANSAQKYAEKASQGVPADERVVHAHLSIEKPYEMPLKDLMAIDSQDEARALKAKLQAQGYDGIHIPDAGKGQWVAFDSGQIKDSRNNIGTFDKANPDIRYRRAEPEGDNHESAASGRAEAVGELGEKQVSKLEKNGVNFQSREDLNATPLSDAKGPLSEADKYSVRGYSQDGSATVIPENTPKGRIVPVLAHEAIHSNLRNILGEPGVERLGNFLRTLAGKKNADGSLANPMLAEAQDAIHPNTRPGAMNEELIGHAAEHVLADPKLADSVWGKIKDRVLNGLDKIGLPQDWAKSNERLVKDFALSNLKHLAEGPGRTFQTATGRVQTPRQDDAELSKPDKSAETVTKTEPPSREPAKAEAQAEPADTTGIKNRKVDESREQRGAELLQSEKGPSLGNRNENAHETLARDPQAGARLVDEVLRNPRPLSQAETDVFNLHHSNVERARDAAAEHINNLPKDAGTMDKARAQIELTEREDELNRVENAARKAGTEASRSLSARKAEVTKDGLFRQLAGLIQAKQGGKALSAEQSAKIRELSNQLKAAHDRVADLEAAQAKGRVSQTSNKTQSKKQAQDKVAALLDKLKNLQSAQSLSRTSEPAKFARADTPTSIIKEIAREYVKGGEDDAQKLVDTVHEAVGKLTGFNRDRVRDTIAGVIKETGIAPTKSEYRARMDNIRAELKADIANQNPDKTKQDRLRKQLADLQAQRDSGILKEPTKRAPVTHTDETFALQQEVNKAKRAIEKMAIKAQQANRSLPEKIADGAIKVQRLFILSHVSALQKLPVAAAVRIISNRLDEAAGSVLRNIPGLSAVAEQAPRHGAGLSFKGDVIEGAKGIGEAFRKGSWDQLTKGFDAIDDAYGSKYKHADEWANLSGRIHSAMKEPAKLDEFYRSFYKRSQHAYNQELKRTGSEQAAQALVDKPSTKYMIGEAAYKDATEAIMQGDNALIDTVDAVLRNINRMGVGGKAVEKLFNILVPIKKVPANIVKETSSYAIGGLKAAPGLIRTAREGVESLSPKDADYIMKNLKKQTVGVALMGLGYAFGPGILGGLEAAFEDKRKGIAEYYNRLKGGKPLAGHIKVGDTDLNQNFSHASPMTVMQAGAQFRAMREKEKDHGVIPGFQDMLRIAGSYTLDESPVVGSLYKTYKYAHEGNKATEIVGNTIRGGIVPGAVEDYAKYQDYQASKDQNKNNALGHVLDVAGGQFHAQSRYPRSVGEAIQTGIPDTPLTRAFSRKTVPSKK